MSSKKNNNDSNKKLKVDDNINNPNDDIIKTDDIVKEQTKDLKAPPVAKLANQESLHNMGSDLIKEENINNNNDDEVDIGALSIDEAFKKLNTSLKGLTDEEAKKRLERDGPNALPEIEVNKCLKFLSFMWNPLSWVMEAAAIVAIGLSNGPTPWLCPENDNECQKQVQPPDWEDFLGICILLILNSVIGYIEEQSAGDAVAKLMDKLSPVCSVKRNGSWKQVDAKDLVAGDIITIKLGDVVPADVKLLNGEPMKIDQSGLTGESLPVTKNPGDEAYSGTTVKKGEIEALVYATGVNTFFGKAANLVATTEQHGHLQMVLSSIGLFCMSYIAIWIIILVIVVYTDFDWDYRRGINMVLVVLIGGIPIAMPTVLSVTMAVGVNMLAKENAIVTRITAVEELAGMDILCSDKTGTLTLNKLEIDTPTTCDNFTKEDVILYAALSAKREGDPDAIDLCITRDAKKNLGENVFDKYNETKFIPFNPTDKRTEAHVTDTETGKKFVCSKGAPQVMIDIAYNADDIREEQEAIINELALRGLRAIGVAIADENCEKWEFVGLAPLLDPPRADTAETITKAIELGVRVKMITGDQVAIGKETARRLGMGMNFHNAKVVRSKFVDGIPIEQIIDEADGFGEVFPEDKYAVVQTLRGIKNKHNKNHLVGMTGDGVNDAPALKVADVGIAVHGATDAARGAADMVLLTEGLSVIITALIGSRKIFQRMKNYAIYACTTTIRVVTTFGLLACIWEFSFPPFMVLIFAYLNDGTIMTISKDWAVASPEPDTWKLREIFTIAFVLGFYLTASSVVFYYLVQFTTFFEDTFNVDPIKYQEIRPIDTGSFQMASLMYLQVSVSGQLIIFSTRSRNFFFTSLASPFLIGAFVIAQLIATLIAVYASWEFTQIHGIGWGWALIVWIWVLIWYLPMDLLKIFTRLLSTGELFDSTLMKQKAMFNFNISGGASHLSGRTSRKAPNSRAYAIASAKRQQKKTN